MWGIMEPEKIDVHRYAERLAEQPELLMKENMLSENRQAITEFIDFCKVNPKIGEGRLIKLYYMLRKIGSACDKPFRQMDEKDVLRMIAKLQDLKTMPRNHQALIRRIDGLSNKLPGARGKDAKKIAAKIDSLKSEMDAIKPRPLSDGTKTDLRKAVVQFWRWLYYDQYYGDKPPMVRRICTSCLQAGGEPEIYTKDEVEKIIAGMRSPRDKAFFSCLYDLGCRVSELLSRQIRHIDYSKNGEIRILIEADKTRKTHWEPLYESVQHFVTWMHTHPNPKDQNAPIWTIRKLDKNGRSYIVPMSYATANKMFDSAISKEGIKTNRKAIMHMLRKSKATHDSDDGVPIQHIEKRGSWSKGSMALRQCYLSAQQKQKDDAYSRKYGLPTDEDEKQKTELKTCLRCSTPLGGRASFCTRCGHPVSMKVAVMQQFVNEAVPEAISKSQLSELVKQYITQALENNDPALLEALKKLKTAKQIPSTKV
jgi:integrase/ribosomal protein L40E